MDVFCVPSFVLTAQIEFSECCVWFQWFTKWCCSCVSNIVVCWCEEKWKKWIVDGCLFVSSFFCLHNSNWVEWVLCLISMIHSMMLFLCLQYCWLLRQREMKRVNCRWMTFVCLLTFIFTTKIEFSECCVWFQCFTQWRCSSFSNLVACWCDEKGERVNCWWMSFVCLLSFAFTTQI